MSGELTEYCEGCDKIIDDHCSVYVDPKLMMRWVENPNIQVGCAFNKQNLIKKGIVKDEDKSNSKVRAGQQKQKKRK